jgi:hypothetical protein
LQWEGEIEWERRRERRRERRSEIRRKAERGYRERSRLKERDWWREINGERNRVEKERD